jgi:hypothetical protein
MSASKKEIQTVKADHRYWQAIEKILPWKVYGFTFRKHASFFTNQWDLLTITGEQRDQIIAALKQPAAKARK